MNPLLTPRTLRRASLLPLLLAASLALGAAIPLAATQATSDATTDWSAALDLLAANGNPTQRLTTTLDALRDAPAERSGLIVASGPRGLAPRELDTLRAFQAAGGRVLVLADPLAAAALGAPLAGAPISPSPATRATTLHATAHLDGRTYPLDLPHATPVLDARADATPLARTTNTTFLDADADGRETTSDASGPFLIATLDPTRRVAVAGAPTLLDATTLALADNHAFARALLTTLFPPGTLVLLDDTRSAPPLDAALRAPLAAASAIPHAALLRIAVPLLLATAGGLAATAAVLERRQDPGHDGAESLDTPIPRPAREVEP